MFKLIATVMIAAGFALGGRHLAVLQKKRVSFLESIILMISTAETQLKYACLPVSDLLKIFNENTALSELEFIRSCREKVCFGEPFPDAWRESIENEAEFCRLLGNSAKNLVSMGSELGSTDLDGQLSCCGYYKNLFEADLEEQREKSEKYSRLFPSMGLLLGISAAILII